MADSTVAFVDLAGFVALTEAHGAAAAADLAERFGELARRSAESSAKVVKAIGDAVMLHAPDPKSGLTAATKLIRACLAEPDFPIARGGIDHGSVEARGNDYYGPAVNLAARLTSHAAGPRLLLTERVLPAALATGFTTEPIGPIYLRNVTRPVTAYAIRLDECEATAVDPVCRMRVDPSTAAGRLRHEGVDYWFCSRECVAAFAGDPVPYVPTR